MFVRKNEKKRRAKNECGWPKREKRYFENEWWGANR